MGERILRFMLVSGAVNKELRLTQELGRISGLVLNDLGIAGIVLRRLDCPVEERNHEPCAPILYDAKARDTHKLMKWELLPDEVGLTVDVHPKVGIPGKSFDTALLKHRDHATLKTRNERTVVGMDYINRLFCKYGNSELLIRLGAGINPWVYKQGLLGLVNANDYIQYDRNILPDEQAAKDMLEYAAETHRDANGNLDNLNLERSVRSPGFILQESVLEWAIRERHIGAEIKTRAEEPLKELDQLVDGFTAEMVHEMIRIAGSHVVYTQSLSRRTTGGVKLLPVRVDKVIWSHDEQRLVTQYVGPYEY